MGVAVILVVHIEPIKIIIYTVIIKQKKIGILFATVKNILVTTLNYVTLTEGTL